MRPGAIAKFNGLMLKKKKPIVRVESRQQYPKPGYCLNGDTRYNDSIAKLESVIKKNKKPTSDINNLRNRFQNPKTFVACCSTVLIKPPAR
jgi:hypothetical protein